MTDPWSGKYGLSKVAPVWSTVSVDCEQGVHNFQPRFDTDGEKLKYVLDICTACGKVVEND